MGTQNMEEFMDTYGFEKNENWNGIHITNKRDKFETISDTNNKKLIEVDNAKKTVDDISSDDVSENKNMYQFKCNKCTRCFSQKGNLKYHIEKNACRTNNYHCKYCNKGFTSDSSMYRHMKYNCKEKKHDIEEKILIHNRLIKLEEEHKKMCEINKNIKEELHNEKNQGKKLKEDIVVMKKVISSQQNLK